MNRFTGTTWAAVCVGARLAVAAVIGSTFLLPEASASMAGSPIPSFTATALSGEKVDSSTRIGQPAVLIVAPSKGAARQTRLWVEALRKNIDQDAIMVRDVSRVGSKRGAVAMRVDTYGHRAVQASRT